MKSLERGTARTHWSAVCVGVFVRLPDKYRSVQQADDRRDIDAHQDLAVDVLQAKVAVLHLSVRHVIVEDQLHLQ